MTALLAQAAQTAPDPNAGSGLWFYAFAGVIALAIFASGVLALRWSVRRGDFPSELEKFDAKALTIFNEEEPLGQQTDFFPGKGRRPSGSAPASPRA